MRGELLRFDKYLGTLTPGTFDIWSSIQSCFILFKEDKCAIVRHFQGWRSVIWPQLKCTQTSVMSLAIFTRLRSRIVKPILVSIYISMSSANYRICYGLRFWYKNPRWVWACNIEDFVKYYTVYTCTQVTSIDILVILLVLQWSLFNLHTCDPKPYISITGPWRSVGVISLADVSQVVML